MKFNIKLLIVAIFLTCIISKNLKVEDKAISGSSSLGTTKTTEQSLIKVNTELKTTIKTVSKESAASSTKSETQTKITAKTTSQATNLASTQTTAKTKQVVNPEIKYLSKPILTRVTPNLVEAEAFNSTELESKKKNYYSDSLGDNKITFPTPRPQINTTNFITPEIIKLTNKTKANIEVTQRPQTKKIILESVSYVPQLSPAGKASLELANSHDYEYEKLLNAGFETPKIISPIIEDLPTNVNRAASGGYLWRGIHPFDTNLWQNVEYNRYQNELLDTHRYTTPAKFTKNEFGNVVVHAPAGSNLQISTPASKTLTSMPNQMNFLDIKDEESLEDEDSMEDMIDIGAEENKNRYYSFLK